MSRYVSEDEGLNREYGEYCFALGHLINSFNRLEGLIAALAVAAAKIAEGSSMFDTPAQHLSSLLERPSIKISFRRLRALLLQQRAAQESLTTFDDIHRQIIQIKEFRDDLVHSPVTSTFQIVPQKWKYLKWKKVAEQNLPTFRLFNSQNLMEAYEDINHAGDVLSGLPETSNFMPGVFKLSQPTWHFRANAVQTATEEVFVELVNAELGVWLSDVAEIK